MYACNPNFVLKNISEDLIDLYLDSCMTAAGVCRCPRCRADVRACALNSFPPRYVVSSRDDAPARLEALFHEYRATAILALIRAIDTVAQSPRHSAPTEAARM